MGSILDILFNHSKRVIQRLEKENEILLLRMKNVKLKKELKELEPKK